MKAKNKVKVNGKFGEFLYSSKGKIACKTHDFLWEKFTNLDYSEKIIWSVFLSNPDYIKIFER